MAPRASSRQCGARSPLKAGTKQTPAVSGTLEATGSTSSGPPMRPSWSRSQLTARPPVATEPSSAYWVGASFPSWKATVVSRPCVEGTMEVPVFMSRKRPVPYVFLASPSRHLWPRVAACWSPTEPLTGTPSRHPRHTVP